MKKEQKKKFEGNPSRSDNLVNWSHTRCQLRHTPELVKGNAPPNPITIPPNGHFRRRLLHASKSI